MPTWREVIVVGLVWLGTFTVLNIAVFIGLGILTWRTYPSVYLLLNYLCFLAVGMGVAYLIRRRARTKVRL